MIIGDSTINHHVFATLDQKQAEHQNTVIEAQGNIQGMKLSILFDSGAADSFISSALVVCSGIPVVKARTKW